MTASPEISLAERLHARLVGEADVGVIGAQSVAEFTRQEAPLLRPDQVERVVADVLARATGLGPLQPLLVDPEVTEVMVNGPKGVWVERGGSLERVALRLDEATIGHLIERIVGPLGLRVDRASPMVDARLPDGSRINAVVPPLAVDGPCLCIRRFTSGAISI